MWEGGRGGISRDGGEKKGPGRNHLRGRRDLLREGKKAVLGGEGGESAQRKVDYLLAGRKGVFSGGKKERPAYPREKLSSSPEEKRGIRFLFVEKPVEHEKEGRRFLFQRKDASCCRGGKGGEKVVNTEPMYEERKKGGREVEEATAPEFYLKRSPA